LKVSRGIRSTPVFVDMRVKYTRCEYVEGETYKFEMPRTEVGPMEGEEPGECARCKALVQIHLRRTQQVQ
jgi:hypothetical protein